MLDNYSTNKEAEIIALGILQHLKKEDKVHLLREILSYLEKEVDNLGKVVTVFSAVRLSEIEKQEVIKSLESFVGKTGDLHFEIDKSLIGGLKVMVGDTVIDLSTSGKLETIAKNLT